MKTEPTTVQCPFPKVYLYHEWFYHWVIFPTQLQLVFVMICWFLNILFFLCTLFFMKLGLSIPSGMECVWRLCALLPNFVAPLPTGRWAAIHFTSVPGWIPVVSWNVLGKSTGRVKTKLVPTFIDFNCLSSKISDSTQRTTFSN